MKISLLKKMKTNIYIKHHYTCFQRIAVCKIDIFWKSLCQFFPFAAHLEFLPVIIYDGVKNVTSENVVCQKDFLGCLQKLKMVIKQ